MSFIGQRKHYGGECRCSGMLFVEPEVWNAGWSGDASETVVLMTDDCMCLSHCSSPLLADTAC